MCQVFLEPVVLHVCCSFRLAKNHGALFWLYSVRCRELRSGFAQNPGIGSSPCPASHQEQIQLSCVSIEDLAAWLSRQCMAFALCTGALHDRPACISLSRYHTISTMKAPETLPCWVFLLLFAIFFLLFFPLNFFRCTSFLKSEFNIFIPQCNVFLFAVINLIVVKICFLLIRNSVKLK